MEEPSAIKSDSVAVGLPGGLNKAFNYDIAKNGGAQMIPPPGLPPPTSGPTTASVASSSGPAPVPMSISHKIDSLMGGSGTSSSATPSSAMDPQTYQQQMYYQQQRMYAQFNQQQQQQAGQMPPQMQAQLMGHANAKPPFINGNFKIGTVLGNCQ